MYSEECAVIIKRIRTIEDRSSDQRVAQVAADLKRISFEPIMLIPADGLCSMRTDEVLELAERTAAMSDEEIGQLGLVFSDEPERVRVDQLKMLLHYFSLIVRLRADDPEAWDEIHELYEDD